MLKNFFNTKKLPSYFGGKIGLISTVILLSLTVFITMINDYNTFRPVPVEVTGSHESAGRYSSKLYLILYSEEWGEFDIIVRPTTFHKYKNGGNVTFILREMDMKQTFWKNAIFIFGQVILWVLSGMYLAWILFNVVKNRFFSGG